MGEFSLDRLDKHLQRLGWTDAEASRKAGLGSTYIRDLRRGTNPTANKLGQLAAAIGTTTHDLMGEEAPEVGIAEGQFFTEDQIKRAIIGCLRSYKGAAQRNPDQFADLVVAVLNVNALEISDSLQSPISSTG